MTQLVINVVDISGGTHPDDKVRLWAPQHRTNGERVVSTSPVDVPLVDGQATVEVLPGPARVQIMTQGVVDSAPKRVSIPDEASATLRAVIEDGLEWEPEVINRVASLASRAESAADRAETVADTFGSLEGVAVSVQAAEDAATSAAGSASAAASSATSANDSQASAAGSATAAAQSAVNAANSEWVAGEHKGAAEAASTAAALSADDAAASAGAAASSETAAATSAGQADASASTASDAADRAENVVDTVQWQDDRLSVMGQLSPPLTGDDGATPYVGANGNWWVGDTDTGVQAQGPKGDSGDGAGDVLWSDLNPVLDGKAAVSHDHTIAQVTGLEDALATAGGPPVIVSTTPPEDTDAIWVNPDEVPPPTGGGTVEQDTGWRNISGTVKLWPTDTWDATEDTLWIRRVGSTVHLMYMRTTDIPANSWGAGDSIPVGFRPAVDTGLIVHGRDNNTGGYLLRTSGMTVWTGPLISSAYFMAPMQGWLTADPWPTTLPGTAVEGV